MPSPRKTPAVLDPELGPLSDDRLTRDFRVWQRIGGHRFSADDMVTAKVAFEARPTARTVCDLGCGLGSVLLQLAWSLPDARLVGVEAQAVSYALLTRNVARNDVSGRVAIHHGDLRDDPVLATLEAAGPFELVTGTPPYFPPSTALDAEDEQRAFARIEYRGGVEVYLAAAARLMTEDGIFVLCGDHEAEPRVMDAARKVGLRATRRLDLIPRERQPTLFSVWTLERDPHDATPRPQDAARVEDRDTHDARAKQLVVTRMTLRDRSGAQTPDALALKAFSGFA